ncbi:MAG: transglutaminase domain-containing protein [Gammaproteobacteria bacterium]|nr:transglutaminase domain-containing protein [Gammaproteobacteria bacterium]
MPVSAGTINCWLTNASTNAARYDLSSHTDYRLIGADNVDFERALALPPNQHPKAVALAKEWRAEGLETREIIDKALAMFHNQTFYYSLNPPLLTGDTVDQFLFETREGFCEHYAAAFTVLMRAAGIPARIVTGYQGGTLNPVGDYYIVRQHDAHAWTEVWANGSWQRVDPTEAVSPARIRDGINMALPETIDDPLGVNRDSWAGRALALLHFNWDAVNNQWNQWVLGYTPTRQRDLLNRMGIQYQNWEQLAFWLAGAIGAFLLAAGLWILSRRRNTADSARRLYDRFCNKLGRAGIKRRSYEGPRDFANRAGRLFNRQSDTIHEITDYYISIRYTSERTNNTTLKYLRQLIRQFKPRTA